MKKKVMKTGIVLLTSAVLGGVFAPSIANADSTNNISESSNTKSTDNSNDYVIFNGDRFSPNNFMTNLKNTTHQLNDSESNNITFNGKSISKSYFIENIGLAMNQFKQINDKNKLKSDNNSNYVNINGKNISKNEFVSRLNDAIPQYDSGLDVSYTNVSSTSRFVPAIAATYFIPGIGEVALTVTGGIVIGGIAIAAGSWLYNKCIEFFNGHRTNVSKKNHDKHTKPRAGRSNEKKKQKKGWHKRK